MEEDVQEKGTMERFGEWYGGLGRIKKILLWVAGVFIALILLGSVLPETEEQASQNVSETTAEQSNADSSGPETVVRTVQSEPETVEAPVEPPPEEPPPEEPASSESSESSEQNTIPGDGTFIVGEDIQSGTYETEGSDFCYWERLSGTSGTFEDIITNGNPTGPTTITISPSDAAFGTQGCSEWTSRSGSASGGDSGSSSGESPDQGTIPGDGTFIVGEDIQPGTYETEGSQSCYWERLSGTSGTMEDVITNGLPTGPTTITISPSDAAFGTQGCSEWTLR